MGGCRGGVGGCGEGVGGVWVGEWVSGSVDGVGVGERLLSL